MGFLYRGACYANQAEARSAQCSDVASVTVATSNLYTSECASTVHTGATFSVCMRTNGGACTSRAVPYQVDVPCAFDNVTLNADLLSLFYLGLGVFAAVLATKWVYNYFRPDRNHES
jgi:hypothetical protein